MFIIGRSFRDGHLGTMAGQPPRRDQEIDRRALDRLVSQPPPPYNIEEYLARPVFTAQGAVADLGLDPALENEWARFLEAAVTGSPREFQMRQQVMERLIREDWDPELRRVMFQRARSLYRNQMEKGMYRIHRPADLLRKAEAEGRPARKPKSKMTPDDVRDAKRAKPPGKDAKRPGGNGKPSVKPSAKKTAGRGKPLVVKGKSRPSKAPPKKPREGSSRGGDYHRRVPNKSGKGFRYYYDPDKYNDRKDSHQSGEDVRRKGMGKELEKMVGKAGEQGCGVQDMAEMVKRYGAKEVSGVLRKQCGEGGGMSYSNGRFYKNR